MPQILKMFIKVVSYPPLLVVTSEKIVMKDELEVYISNLKVTHLQVTSAKV